MRRRGTRRGSIVAWALAAAMVAIAARDTPAAADVALDARFFDGQARKAFAAGRYEEALELFLHSQAAVPFASNLYNIALSAEQAQHAELAFSFYRDYLATEEPVFRDEATAHLARLERRVALIEVQTVPAGAEIYVDALDLGAHGRTPSRVAVPPGTREVIVTLEGHEPTSAQVTARRGQQTVVSFELSPHLGRLQVDARPAGGRLVVERDGEVVTQANGGTIDAALPVGTYQVRYERRGRLEVERDVTIRRDDTERVSLVAPTATLHGRVLVTAGAVRGEVYLDGERVGETPATLERVPTGPHVIEVRADGRTPWRQEVDVAEGAAVLLRASLPKPD